MQTTAKNLYKLGGGLHIGLDQSGTGLEVDFQGKKSDTPQSGAELDANEQSVSTNTQSVTKENVQTTAENQDNFEAGLHIGLDQSGSGLEVDFQAEKTDPDQVTVKPDVNEEVVSTNTQLENKEDVQTITENLSLAGETSETQSTQFVVYWDDLIRQIDAQMERIGWSVERGRQYLLNKYGVRSRLLLSDEQVFEFLAFLQTQPTPQPAWKVGQECLYNGVKVVIERLINSVVAVVRRIGTIEEVEVALVHLKPMAG